VRNGALSNLGQTVLLMLPLATLLLVFSGGGQMVRAQTGGIQVATPVAGTPLPPAGMPSSPVGAVEPSRDSCRPGTGWTWTYGPSEPELAARVQADLRSRKIDATVEARDFGETDSCGSFARYAVDFNLTVSQPTAASQAERDELGRQIYPLLQQHASPRIGKVALTFAFNGERLMLDSPPDASGSPASLPLALPATDGPAIHRRVHVIVYDPMLSNGQLLHEYMGWSQHEDLTQGTIALFADASHGYVQYEVATTSLITDEWPVMLDGFRYTEEEYLEVMSGALPPHEPAHIDYNAILNDPDLDPCGELNRGEIDEVWLYGGPNFGEFESTLAGPGAFRYNSPPVPDLNTCGRLMTIMGPSYERGLNCAVHNFIHRTESTMVQVYGSWEQNRTLHNWDRFGLVLDQSPDYWYSGCGSGHYPPNGQTDYDYSNPSAVPSICDDFANYPDLGHPSDTARAITCSAWGCDETGYMRWWHSHLPASPGCGPDTVGNNWWNYFAVPALANDPPSACAPTGLSIAGPALGETDAPQVFTAALTAVTGTLPITYTWSTTGQSPVEHVTAELKDTADFTWASAGWVTVTVTATFREQSLLSSVTSEITSTHLLTKTFALVQGSDDAGPDDSCDYSTGHNEIYFGQCSDEQEMTSGFRFENVAIPWHSRILAAYLEFTVDGTYGNDLSLQLFGEDTANAQTFSTGSPPASRPLTKAFVVWPIPSSDVWAMGLMRRTPNLSAIIQELVDRDDWSSGNSLAVIGSNAGATDPPGAHRRVFAYERDEEGQHAAKLVVFYSETPVEAGFSAIPSSGPAPLTIQFIDDSKGPVTDWLWSFGDGYTSTLSSPIHTYSSPRPYTVTLTVDGPGGSNSLVRSSYVTAYEAVNAQFAGSPTTGAAPLSVSLTNQSTGDYDTCAWQFGDGATSSDCDDPTYSYTAAGVYSVTLTVNGSGGTDTEIHTDYVTVYRPVSADFLGDPSSGPAPLFVAFANHSTGDYDVCTWSFGDGEASDGCNGPSHLYNTPGVFSATLTVSGPGSTDSLTKTHYISVYEPARADFTATVTSGPAPLLVALANHSTGEYDACAWTFGDGRSDRSCQDPTHTYTETGVYTVSLAVSGRGGSDTRVRADYVKVLDQHRIYLPLAARECCGQ
jgi:PKD repeat protein